jgi:hypothetical protein
MKKPTEHQNDDMRQEYDFASMNGGVRGKHYDEYRKETNVVLLKPDVAEAFPTEDAVNEALRGILSTARGAKDRRSPGSVSPARPRLVQKQPSPPVTMRGLGIASSIPQSGHELSLDAPLPPKWTSTMVKKLVTIKTIK